MGEFLCQIRDGGPSIDTTTIRRSAPAARRQEVGLFTKKTTMFTMRCQTVRGSDSRPLLPLYRPPAPLLSWCAASGIQLHGHMGLWCPVLENEPAIPD